MKYLMRSFIPRLYHIRIEGQIDSQLTNTIANGLHSAWPYYPQALLVTINSSGGSLIQANNISDLLKIQSHQYNIPIYTFAEDSCIGSATIILTTGVKCYASGFSMIGDLGNVWSKLWFNRLANNYQIKQQNVKVNETKVNLNPIEELKAQDQEWIKTHNSSIENDMKKSVLENRRDNIKKKGLSEDKIESEVLGVGVSSVQNYIKHGLVDQIKSFDQIIRQKFSSSKIKEIKQKKIHGLG